MRGTSTNLSTVWRLARNALGGTVRIFALCWLAVHFALTVLYVMPVNPIKPSIQPLLAATIGTYFPQNWNLFAPNPVSSDLAFLVLPLTASMAREAAEGRMPSEGWYDLSTPLWEHFQQNRLTAYDRLARPQASGIRMFLNGGSQLAPWAEACRKGDDDACELFEERLTSARALARTFLVRIASAFCNDIVPHRADVTFVALRMRERTSVPWSLRYTSERTERLLDLGVHPIDRGVVAPGLYVGKAR